MYEEEDDDLPAQYRRLTAHLNTNSSDFNRRLATYLTNHVAMRQALDQALSNSYAQTGQNWTPNGQNPQQMGSPWMQNPGMLGQQFPTMIQPSMMHYQSPFRHTPYPMPNAYGMNTNASGTRPQSISTANHTQAASMPASTLTSPVGDFNFEDAQSNAVSGGNGSPANNPSSPENRGSPNNFRAPFNQHAHTEPNTPSFLPTPDSSGPGDGPQESNNQQAHNPFAQNMAQQQQHQSSASPPLMSPLSSPFQSLSTTLPPETQMFFGQGIHQDGNKQSQQPFYNYNPNAHSKKISDASNGMSQTLAPGAFEQKLEQTAWPTPPTMGDDLVSPFTAVGSAKFGLDSHFSNDMMSQSFMPTTPYFATDGQNTPDEFSSLIDQSLWDDSAAPA